MYTYIYIYIVHAPSLGPLPVGRWALYHPTKNAIAASPPIADCTRALDVPCSRPNIPCNYNTGSDNTGSKRLDLIHRGLNHWKLLGIPMSCYTKFLDVCCFCSSSNRTWEELSQWEHAWATHDKSASETANGSSQNAIYKRRCFLELATLYETCCNAYFVISLSLSIYIYIHI